MAKTAGRGERPTGQRTGRPPARRPAPASASNKRQPAKVYRRRRITVGLALLLVLGTGYAALDAADIAPGVLTTTEPWPEAEPFPQPALPGPVAEAAVPGLSEDAPMPTTEAVTELTAELLPPAVAGPEPGVMVTDVASGTELLAQNVADAYVPASSLKVLVALAAVATYGDQHRFETTVTTGGDGQIALVGGGDLALAAGSGDPEAVVGHAGLGDIAAQTAEALTEQGVTSVQLALDDTLFTGPSLAPRWADVDLANGWAMHMSPLAVDIGRIDGQLPRSTDAGMDAAETFAEALTDAGITVEGGIERAPATEGGTALATVSSATLGEIVGYTLQASENILSETLGRMTAVGTGHEASFAGASEAVLAVLAELGLDTSGNTMVDASGVSSASELTPQLLTSAVQLAADGTHPELLSIVDGVPVAGLEGTLASRLGDGAAAGTLRAKTGTLPQAISLTGLVTTAEGRLLAFTVLANDFDSGGAWGVRGAVDEWATALAACGCR